jgi:hypothetical protein
MTSDEERCAEARKLQRIDDAFRAGDLEGLRAALEDPAVVPNGPMPDTVGSCLVHAIYHSPLAFIRTLLELGADPNAPVDDGFPPLIAVLSTVRQVPGSTPRTDADEVLRLLLAYGADPNQRGINDYTPLHMAVDMRYLLGVQILLDAGADPSLRTRIDDCDTPEEMARSAGLEAFTAVLARKGQPLRQRLRSGLTLLADIPGDGDPVRRQHGCVIRLRLWLSGGEPVRWTAAWGPVSVASLEDDGATLVTQVHVTRGRLVSGIFYGLDGMRVGGMRRLEIAPHQAYGERGVPGVIPPNAVLTAEVTVLAVATAAVRPT